MRVGAVALVGMAVPSRPRVVAGMGPHGPRHPTPGASTTRGRLGEPSLPRAASTTRGRLGEPSLPRAGTVIEFQQCDCGIRMRGAGNEFVHPLNTQHSTLNLPSPPPYSTVPRRISIAALK